MNPTPTLDDLRLEQGTALSHLWDAADSMRQTAGDLLHAVEAHAMTSFRYLRAVADGQRPDPSALLRSRGRLDALLSRMNDQATFEADQLGELRFGMLANDDGDPELEARALRSFRERFRRRGEDDGDGGEGGGGEAQGAGEPLPEDPRPAVPGGHRAAPAPRVRPETCGKEDVQVQ